MAEEEVFLFCETCKSNGYVFLLRHMKRKDSSIVHYYTAENYNSRVSFG